MNRPLLANSWALYGRVFLLLCVWPLMTTAQSMARQRPLPWTWSIIPSDDGRLLWIKSASAARREAYAVFNWETGRLQTCERRETAFMKPDALKFATILRTPGSLATMDRDVKNGWALVSDGQRTFVVDEATGNELHAIAGAYVAGRFVPDTKELVYVGPRNVLNRVQLPSGQIAAMHQPWDAYWPLAVAWAIALGCWLGGWFLLLAVYGSVWWLDVAALSIAAMLLSAAFHQPHFDFTHAQLTVGLLTSLAVIAGLGTGALSASLPMIAAMAIAAGTTLALCLSLAVNTVFDRPSVAQLGVGLFVVATCMCLAMLLRRSIGWHVADSDAPVGVRPARPPASLLHIFLLTASCAYLLMVYRAIGGAALTWNQNALVRAMQLPVIGLVVGIAATSAGLSLRRWKWAMALICGAALGLLCMPIVWAGGGLSSLWPRAPAPIGPGIAIWSGLFTALWIYLLRSSGLRMRKYAPSQVV